jgi:hypothetical protein
MALRLVRKTCGCQLILRCFELRFQSLYTSKRLTFGLLWLQSFQLRDHFMN